MRSRLLFTLSLALLAGCATFKELQPKPELSPVERGYIELKNDKEDFQLDQGKRYFIRFPRPLKDHFALVLQTNAKWYIVTYLTRAFDDGKEPIVRMPDEAPAQDSAIVYAVDLSSGTYFWVIDSVRQDIALHLRYRYVPRWRYTFENEYAGFKQTLSMSLVDRSTYLSMPGATPIDSVDFEKQLEYVGGRTSKLTAMNMELKKVADLFPPDIAAANDTAYQNYKALRASVEDEIQFQQNYAAALSVFQKEKNAGKNTGLFLADAAVYSEFLRQRDRYPAPIVDKVKKSVTLRLNDAVPYYEQQLRNKKDIKPFVPDPPLEPVQNLYVSMGREIPPAFAALSAFVGRFNLESAALQTATVRLKDLHALVDRTTAPPAAPFYGRVDSLARVAREGIPPALAASNERYRGFESATLLALELGKAGEQAEDFQSLFGTGVNIQSDIAVRAWGAAESKTRDLYERRSGRTYASVERHRIKVVRWAETDIFNGVRVATHDRLEAFIKLNESAYADVARLYADSAFLPAYNLTFSSSGPAGLSQKKSQIGDYINRVRHFQFPEAAIRAIYAGFTRDMNVPEGVDRARAVVEHGKEYKGDDKQLTSIVSECDPNAPKWITRPKEYRRILALPVTNNRKGSNDYMFRIRLEIPSDAQFPVFDVNIKLPRELAEGAGREQWYDRITINNTPIKNEGRFRITSPSSDNGYESQITPVQMDKEGKNILEVRFRKSSYKVYEISAMAQVPIMKKN
ncbi:MAG TPA: hypothetical protein VK569_07415 [Bacteroidota bacterium]|nr:hypothetical protein [Bacteroidota bacterium]